MASSAYGTVVGEFLAFIGGRGGVAGLDGAVIGMFVQFGDLDWPGKQVSVVQAKTGRRVVLPLLKDVGWAIIDYVRDGRPASDCPQVFLRHTAPIGPFSDQDHLHQILVKHARAAHVRLGEQRRHGMHSLRHTLATRGAARARERSGSTARACPKRPRPPQRLFPVPSTAPRIPPPAQHKSAPVPRRSWSERATPALALRARRRGGCA
jgi:hypothetical protein